MAAATQEIGLKHDKKDAARSTYAFACDRVAPMPPVDPTPFLAAIAELTATVSKQADTIDKLRGEISELRRMLFGPRSERVVPINQELREKNDNGSSPRSRDLSDPARKRKKKDKNKTHPNVELPVQDVIHALNACPTCASTKLDNFGEPELSEEIVYEPARLVCRRHHREKKRCRGCGEIHTAQGPQKVIDGGRYDASVYAQVAIAKCADSLPLHRQAKQFERWGYDIARSTLCDLFHRTAELLSPLHARLLELIAEAPHVHADETPHLIQAPGKCKIGFVWTFVAEDIIAYEFSTTRSGETPARILGKSQGTFQADAFGGYNIIAVLEGRIRAGCNGHARRKFFDTLPHNPTEARIALDFFLEIYNVEYEAASLGVLGTEKHLVLRQLGMRPIFERFRQWIEEEIPRHRPKGLLGKALRYAKKQWKELTAVLTNVRIALDNNIAEAALRIIALGRKNFTFVGHEQAGKNLAILQSLISTCIANHVNPQDYIQDVLLRIETTPASKIDELLPQRWTKIETFTAITALVA